MPLGRWLGGSAGAGKSAVAERLAVEHGLRRVSLDERFAAHRRRADPARHPRFCALMNLPPDRLFAPPATDQAAALAAFYADGLELAIEDLAALGGPSSQPATRRDVSPLPDRSPAARSEDSLLLIEGAGLLPTVLAAAGAVPGRSVWLLSTPAFRRRVYREKRPEALALLDRCPDPEAAFARWMERDDLWADRLAAEARRVGAPIIEVDGTRPVGEIAHEAARHLGLG